MSFLALVARDVRLATRVGGSAFLALAFFALAATFVPLGLGAENALLRRVAAGEVWVAAVLAALLSLDRMFLTDFEDGNLEILALGPLSLETVATAKIAAHWLTTGLPLTAFSPAIGLLLGLPANGYAALILSLAVGTPAISAIGAIGASLTLSVRRGGLILPLLVLPLLAPVIIFGAGSVKSGIEGLANGALMLLAGFTFVAVLLSPFAAAAGLRLNLSV